MQYVPAPDFPTGGIIMGRAGTNAAYRTGRGAVVVRGKTHVEEIRKDREAIVFTELPYQVNKAKLVERIAETVREKLIEGISDLRDESDREGLRVVIELKRDAEPDIVLNQLHRHTALQTSFGVNMLALNGGPPELLTLRDIIAAFVAFREEVITRRRQTSGGPAPRGETATRRATRCRLSRRARRGRRWSGPPPPPATRGGCPAPPPAPARAAGAARPPGRPAKGFGSASPRPRCHW